MSSVITSITNRLRRCSCTSKGTHHPGFAAEVVDGEERVNAGNGAEVQADHEAPEVLSRGHAVGVLADQNKIWPERSAETNTDTHGFRRPPRRRTVCEIKVKTCTNKINSI